MNVSLRLLLVCAAAFFGMSCAAFASAKHGEPPTGGMLVEGSIGEPSVLVPMLASDSASHEAASLLFRGLVRYDTDLTLIGDLARSWDITNEGRTITFHLKQNVVWEDGTPFTAEDVYFGFKTITDKNTPTAYAGDYLQVSKAEVPDAHTFRVTYDKPFAPALATWGNMVVLPRHILEGTDITKSSFLRNPIGLGPFRLKKWVAGERLIFEASPSYYKGGPFLDNYLFRFIPDTATQFLELQAGSLDIMSLTPMQYTRQTETAFFKKNFTKFKYPAFSYTYLAFNFRHPWFRDKRVRQAVSYAIDKQEIVNGVLLGLGREATGPYVPDTWPYNPDVKRYPHDPAKARRLLNDAGWSDSDGDGVLDKNGHAFAFTILTNLGNPLRRKAATIIQWRLEKIGIKVDIRVIEWATFINEFVDKRRFQAIILGWSIGLDPDQYDIWHSSKTGEKELNFISYKNAEADELLEKARRIYDRSKRRRLYCKFQEILAEEQPYVFLYVPYALPIVSSRFKNVEATPIGIMYNIDRWYVPKQLQKHKRIP